MAAAAEYTVDSTGDQVDEAPGSEGCKTALNTCTLRAAIEESNLASTSINEIGFDGGVFSGQAAGTINLGGGLPPITEPVRIEGGHCQTESGVIGPCVTINGTNSSAALTVESDETAIENLHILNASIGIEVAAGEEFELLGNWFGGGPLSGPMLGGDGTGILIGTGSGGGVVGGKASTDGNLFLSGGTGIEIHGASHVKVLGNRFGFEPDGTASEWPYGVDIQVTSAPSAGYEAVENEIGTTLSDAALATPACDGGCNLMAGAGYTLILFSLSNIYGQDGPPVDTRISGNDIGLDAAGIATVSTSGGISTGSSLGTIVGGPEPGDGNRINGVGDAISGGGAELMIANNLIGVDSTGSEILAPAHGGIAVYSGFEDPSLEATIVENEIGLKGGRGITNEGLGATIAGNVIVGAEHGIYTNGDSGELGNLIEGNLIEASEAAGVYLENSNNEIYGNEVIESGGTGIYIAGHQPAGATENVVGGNTEASENDISFNGGPAIAISAREQTENEVARNHGFENEEPFIRLWAVDAFSEPLGPNGGIEPPAFSTATNVSASGSGAEPGAVVRVFRNEFEDEGELGAFLGQAVVDSLGNWTVEYAAIPAGSFVTATQTLAGGTSELAMAATPGPAGGGAEEGTGVGGGGVTTRPTEQPAAVFPQTKIFKSVLKRRPPIFVFHFQATEPGSTFRCKLDRHPFAVCPSSKRFGHLKPGRHILKVAAVDAAGNKDPTPALARFSFPHTRKRHQRAKRGPGKR